MNDYVSDATCLVIAVTVRIRNCLNLAVSHNIYCLA